MRKKITKKDVVEKGSKTIAEFKDFISKGNVVDLAVGVIMGGAFGKIVTSLVSDILTPAIGIVMGGIDFTGLSFTIKDSVIAYGNFIQNIIDFLIQAFCIFLFVKLINKFFTKKEEEAKAAEPVKPQDVLLLEEIRDLLKEKSKVEEIEE